MDEMDKGKTPTPFYLCILRCNANKKQFTNVNV